MDIVQRMKKYCYIFVGLNILCLLCFVIKQITGASADSTITQADETVCGQQAEEERPKLAITFDDGPNPEWTPALLDGLKQRGVKASFFVIGEKAQSNPDIILRMVREGHVVGNHTFTHVQLTGLTQQQACAEITKTNEVLKEIMGSSPIYIRPPFGSWNEELECGVSMFPVMWTIDTLDWTTSDADKVVNKAVSQAKAGSIILLHDNYESSVQAALRIIDILQKKGFEFVTVEELMLD